MSQSSPLERWSVLVVLLFLTAITFLFFHLYLRVPEPINTADRLTPLEVPEVTFINPRRGAEEPAVTIVEFGDYECPGCLEMSGNIAVLLNEFPDELMHVWKDFPNEDLHPQATAAAVAARCAQQQGTFWNFHDGLFARQNRLNEETYREVALTLELDIVSFTQCTEAATTLPRIQEDFEEGLQLNLTATPTVFVGTERFVGSVSIDVLREAIITQIR